MQKPTSSMMAAVLNFVLKDRHVLESLSKRDNDKFTRGHSINCRFYKYHPTDPDINFYVVEFKFATKYQEDEQNDDIGLMVEVNAQDTPALFIRDIKYF